MRQQQQRQPHHKSLVQSVCMYTPRHFHANLQQQQQQQQQAESCLGSVHDARDGNSGAAACQEGDGLKDELLQTFRKLMDTAAKVKSRQGESKLCGGGCSTEVDAVSDLLCTLRGHAVTEPLRGTDVSAALCMAEAAAAASSAVGCVSSNSIGHSRARPLQEKHAEETLPGAVATVAALHARERQLFELQEQIQELQDRNQCLETRNTELRDGTSRAVLAAQQASVAGARARQAREDQAKKLHQRISTQEQELLRLRAAAYKMKNDPQRCADIQLPGADVALPASQQIWAGVPLSLPPDVQQGTSTTGCGQARHISPERRPLHCSATGHVIHPVSLDSASIREPQRSARHSIAMAPGSRSVSPTQRQERQLSSGQSQPPSCEMLLNSPMVPLPLQGIFSSGSAVAQQVATWPRHEQVAGDATRAAQAARFMVASSPCRQRFNACPTPPVPPLVSKASLGGHHVTPPLVRHVVQMAP